MDQKIFKAYDIRGVYPQEIDEEAVYKIGQAFAEFIKALSKKDSPQIVIGRDNRSSSDSLFERLEEGMTDQGADVINIGLSSTPMLYFAVANYGYDGGINITASHNPPQYNGLKMVRERAITLSETNGIMDIKEMVMSGNIVKSERKGSVIEKDVSFDYISFNKPKESFGLEVVVDTANSVSGLLVPEMLKGEKVTHIFSELDGSFPNHNPDPLGEENTRVLREIIAKEGADIGVAFDGDGDRVSFIDEKGEIISSDLILALVSSIILRDNPESKIFYDIRCSNIACETIIGLGGEAIPSRVGHSFIKEKMRKENIVFGAEYSGHYYLKQGNDYYEAPYFALFSILKEIKESGKTLSQLIAPLRRYSHSGEINFKVEDKEGIIEKAKEKYKEGRLLTIDGIRIDFDDWWFSLRASNTEPLLRLIVEAKNEGLMKEKVKELEDIITAR